MAKGGILYDYRTLRVMSIIALVAPLLMLVYGLFVVTGVAQSDNYYSVASFTIIMSIWVALAVYQYAYLPTNRIRMLVYLVAYHALAAAYILFISGFSMPFISAWALLYLASYLYFSYAGVYVSVACFMAVLLLDGLLSSSPNHNVTFDISASVSILLVGVAAIALNRIKELDRETLAASQRGEALQRDRTLTLINNLADAVISTDEKGVIQVYNAAALNLLDTNAGLNGQRIDDVLQLHLDNAPIHLSTLLTKSRSVTIEDGFTAKIGDEDVRFEITYAPIRSSHAQMTEEKSSDGYVIIIRDVTKSKSLEEERDEFISVVSHELRTPIAVTEGAIDNARLIFEKDVANKAAVTKTLTLAHDQVVFLSKMVNDLSTLSRAERGAADSAEVIDVVEMAHNLHAEYSTQAEKKGLAFNLSIVGRPGNVNVSRLYLEELLQNFITNAIKYTKDGHVTLHIEAKSNTIHFAVEDSGIGISKGDQKKIFDKFYRAEDYRTRETSGTGLGLYVAIKLARKLHTTIEVKSRLNHGSTFSFALPICDQSTLDG